MKNFRFDLSGIVRSLRETALGFPVESLLTAALFLLATFAAADAEYARDIQENTLFFPAFLFATLALNRLFTARLRPVYWVGIVFVPLLLCVDMSDAVRTAVLPVSTAVGALALLAAEGGRDNERFARRAVGLLSSAATALIFAGVIFLLFLAIFFSTSYIFNIFTDIRSEVVEHASIVVFELFMPLMWLDSLRRSNDGRITLTRAGEVMLDYIMTPALLIYMAILYAYFLKIALTWSLPKGGIAYMVFAFTMVVMAVGACQSMVGKRRYDIFFNRFSLWSLPAVAMFWIGSLYRVGQYGLTESRIYLLACGVIMTAALALFASRRTGRYLYVCTFAAALLAVLTYLPPISAERLGLQSQQRRALRLGSELGLLSPGGMLSAETLRRIDPAAIDTLKARQYHELGEALYYIYNAGGLSRMGDIDSEDIGRLTSIRETAACTRDDLYLTFYYDDIDISGYFRLCSVYRTDDNKGYVLYDDTKRRTLEIRLEGKVVLSVDYDEILRLMLAAEGKTPSEVSRAWLETHSKSLAALELNDFKIVFDSASIEFTDGRPHISSFSPRFLLVRAGTGDKEP